MDRRRKAEGLGCKQDVTPESVRQSREPETERRGVGG